VGATTFSSLTGKSGFIYVPITNNLEFFEILDTLSLLQMRVTFINIKTFVATTIFSQGHTSMAVCGERRQSLRKSAVVSISYNTQSSVTLLRILYLQQSFLRLLISKFIMRMGE
jgi:hypothetical protein